MLRPVGCSPGDLKLDCVSCLSDLLCFLSYAVNERKRYGENLSSVLSKDKRLAKVVRGLLKPTRVVVRKYEHMC